MELVNWDLIQNILLDRNDIEDIIAFRDVDIFKKNYIFVIKCKVNINTLFVPILICIPIDWYTDLFDFYIINYGIKKDYGCLTGKLGYYDCQFFNKFIPHVSPYDGKMCLFNLDSVLIDINFSGLLNQCIDTAKKILSEGINHTNQEDFIKEFTSYWGNMYMSKIAKLCIPDSEVSLLKCIKENEYGIIAAQNQSELNFWTKPKTLYNSIYFKFQLNDSIFPPDPRNNVPLDFLNNLLLCINKKDLRKIANKIKPPVFLFFDFDNPLSTSNKKIRTIIGLEIIEGKIDNNGMTCTPETKIEAITVDRIDKKYLMKRTNSKENPISKMNILLIGCGSIGGYLSDLLITSGCEKLTLVDADVFSELNICRHVLGGKYVDKKKVDALKYYLTNKIPNVTINPIAKKIEMAVLNKDINLSEYDYIFSVTGNQNVNRWLEEYIDTNKLETKIIYGWNEPLDIGSHAVFVNTIYSGRLKSLFSVSDKYNCIYDNSAYTEPNQKITVDNSGCGGSYVPYGTEVSIKTSIHCISLLKRDIYSSLKKNIIISEKGEGFFFKEANLKVSEVYNAQAEIIAEKAL